jgi:hypothetical protein
MKKIAIIILICFCTRSALSQNTFNNELNTHVKEVVFSQMLNRFEIDIPVIISTRWFISFLNINLFDEKIFFNYNFQKLDELDDISDISEEELFNELDIEFVP